jgi:hypothetical protein
MILENCARVSQVTLAQKKLLVINKSQISYLIKVDEMASSPVNHVFVTLISKYQSHKANEKLFEFFEKC